MEDAWISIEGPISDADLAEANTRLATLRTAVKSHGLVEFALESDPGPERDAEAYFTAFTTQWLHELPADRAGYFLEDDYAATDWPYLAAYLQAAVDCFPRHRVQYSDESLTHAHWVTDEIFAWLDELWDDPAVHAWAQEEGTGVCSHRRSNIEIVDTNSPLRIPDAYNRPLIEWNCPCGLQVRLPGSPATPEDLRALSDENLVLVATMVSSGRHTFAAARSAAEATDT